MKKFVPIAIALAAAALLSSCVSEDASESESRIALPVQTAAETEKAVPAAESFSGNGIPFDALDEGWLGLDSGSGGDTVFFRIPYTDWVVGGGFSFEYYSQAENMRERAGESFVPVITSGRVKMCGTVFVFEDGVMHEEGTERYFRASDMTEVKRYGVVITLPCESGFADRVYPEDAEGPDAGTDVEIDITFTLPGGISTDFTAEYKDVPAARFANGERIIK